jgi:hypothetical protein
MTGINLFYFFSKKKVENNDHGAWNCGEKACSHLPTDTGCHQFGSKEGVN